MFVNYRGQIVGNQSYGGVSTFISGPIDIGALRHHRCNSSWTNWMKDLKTEMYRLIYEDAIYPKNLYLDRVPMNHEEYAEKVTQRQIALMQEKGIWKT